eukprot:TRINITY_DN124_c0_g1_i1.p1 TRINITY_DN124_c0_g1~~TRINITY_DN124_c0_g1_i1.p1  ORF type:complete len:254 (+),score=40.54 TRINITY_DN124_c0_g1_i1:82-762(+)
MASNTTATTRKNSKANAAPPPPGYPDGGAAAAENDSKDKEKEVDSNAAQDKERGLNIQIDFGGGGHRKKPYGGYAAGQPVYAQRPFKGGGIRRQEYAYEQGQHAYAPRPANANMRYNYEAGYEQGGRMNMCEKPAWNYHPQQQYEHDDETVNVRLKPHPYDSHGQAQAYSYDEMEDADEQFPPAQMQHHKLGKMQSHAYDYSSAYAPPKKTPNGGYYAMQQEYAYY